MPNVDMEPGLPADVIRAVGDALEDDAHAAVDPWWKAGNDEALADLSADD